MILIPPPNNVRKLKTTGYRAINRGFNIQKYI